jgi:hypothetical protein
MEGRDAAMRYDFDNKASLNDRITPAAKRSLGSDSRVNGRFIEVCTPLSARRLLCEHEPELIQDES